MRIKKNPPNKAMMVLGYLSRYGSINRHTALTHFQIWDLHKIIYELKKKGHDIETKGDGDNLKYTISKQAEKYISKPQHKEITTNQ